MPERPRKSPPHPALAHLVDTGAAWISRLRLKALFWVLAIALAAWATVALTSIAWVPIVGVAAVAAAVSINRLAERLSHPTCWSCGTDLRGRPLGEHGAVCPSCGALHMPLPDAAGRHALAASQNDPSEPADDQRPAA